MARKYRRRLDPSAIRELVPSILKDLRGPAGDRVERARRAWTEIVGEAMARRTRVVGVGQGFLQVVVASAALKHDLVTFRAETILAGLREKLPEWRLRGVRYRVGAVG